MGALNCAPVPLEKPWMLKPRHPEPLSQPRRIVLLLIFPDAHAPYDGEGATVCSPPFAVGDRRCSQGPASNSVTPHCGHSSAEEGETGTESWVRVRVLPLILLRREAQRPWLVREWEVVGAGDFRAAFSCFVSETPPRREEYCKQRKLCPVIE